LHAVLDGGDPGDRGGGGRGDSKEEPAASRGCFEPALRVDNAGGGEARRMGEAGCSDAGGGAVSLDSGRVEGGGGTRDWPRACKRGRETAMHPRAGGGVVEVNVEVLLGDGDLAGGTLVEGGFADGSAALLCGKREFT